MPSSSVTVAWRSVACGWLVLAGACAATGAPPATSTLLLDASQCQPTAAQRPAALLAWHRSTQQLPLFAATASARPGTVPACTLTENAGALEADYRFADGSTLEARSDPAIEYVSVLLRFAAPKAIDAPATLAATERALFGANGCGIDWAHPEAVPATAARGATARFAGDSCNCKAAVERSAHGGVVSLGLSAAC